MHSICCSPVLEHKGRTAPAESYCDHCRLAVDDMVDATHLET